MKELLLAMDIGNVCVRIDHENFSRLLNIEEIPAAMRQLIQDHEFGKIVSEEEFFTRASGIFDGRFSIAELKAAFDAVIVEPVPGMAELVSTFAARNIKAVFFSDTSTTHLAHIRALFPAFDVISDGIFSFECGAWKPSPAMFESFEKLYGIPDLYVDDRKDLIDAAKKRPWNAEVFTGAQDLLEKLQALS